MYKLGRLIPLHTRVMKIAKHLRYKVFMLQATLHSIISDLDDIIHTNGISKGFWRPTV